MAVGALADPREHDQRDGVGRQQADVDEELQKVLLVPFADAVVDPRAVVVHAPHAAPADAAVVRPGRPVRLAPDRRRISGVWFSRLHTHWYIGSDWL